jgi:hypothetical protein
MAALMKTDMANAQGGGLDVSILDILAGLGTQGANPQHCHRDLLSQLPKPRPPSIFSGAVLYLYSGVVLCIYIVGLSFKGYRR